MMRRALPLIALLAVAGCEEAVQPQIATESSSAQVTYGMNLKITEEGRLKADLYADTAVTPAGETRSQLTGVKLTFYNPGEPPGNLTSKTGEYDQATGIMVARGNVVLLAPAEKGMRTIKSEELHWDQRGDRVWSQKPTSITQEGQTLYTKDFTSNARFTNVSGTDARTSGVKVGDGGVRF